MSRHVRAMQDADIDRIYAIELQAHRAPWSREILSDCVLVGYDCRVLEFDHGTSLEIISYIISRYFANYCHVLNLCVSPPHQGLGNGQYLLQKVIDSLPPEIDTLTLEVRPSNAAALSLYERMGFVQVGLKRNYYADDFGIEDGVILEKKLQGIAGSG